MPTPSAKLDVHHQIESAQTLASRFYTDPAILDAEKSRIFRRTWQLVGTLSQPCSAVANAGVPVAISGPTFQAAPPPGFEGGSSPNKPLTISDPETFFTAD